MYSRILISTLPFVVQWNIPVGTYGVLAYLTLPTLDLGNLPTYLPTYT